MDVVTIGESMVQLTPTRTGLLRYASRFERFVAGAASNVAIGLTRLGHSAGWVSRVGKDEFGECVKFNVQGEGVDVSNVTYDGEARTGIYFKERRQPDVTRVHYYRDGSAASRLSPDDIDPTYFSKASHVHLTGIMPALSSTCREAIWKVLHLADDRGLHVSLDPNIRQRLWTEEEAREVLLQMLPYTDLVLASAHEAQLLSDETSFEEAAHFLKEVGPSQVVVRCGEEGALGLNASGEIERSPGISVEVVEEVGAGDAFNAGFLSGQLRGWNLGASLYLGNILGGLATTVTGDVEALPTWDEVQSYLDGEEPIMR